MALPEFGSQEFLTKATGENTMASGLTTAPTATPPPPSEYMPADNRPDHVKFLEGFGAGISGVLPMRLQIRAAELEAKQKELTISQGWQNYHKSQTLMERITIEHNANMDIEGMNSVSRGRAVISALPKGSPERDAAISHYNRLIGGQSPSALKVWNSYVANPEKHYAINLLVSKYPDLQALSESIGYDKLLTNPLYLQHAETYGKDVIHSLVSRFGKDEVVKLTAGKMTQNEFSTLVDRYALDPSGEPITPQEHQFVKEWVASSAAEPYLAGLGVKLERAAQLYQERHATLSLTKLEQDERLLQLSTKMKSGEILTAEEQKDYNILSGTQAKISGAIPKAITAADTELVNALPGSGIHNYTELQDRITQLMTDGNYDEASKLMTAGRDARKRAYEGYALGKQQVGLAGPADVSEIDLYKRTGETVEKVLTPGLTMAQKMSGKYGIVLKPKQQEDVTGLETARLQSGEVFDMAQRLFTATDSVGIAKQKAIELDVKYGGGAARHDPLWKTYVDEMDAWAGRFARVLGTERGVMTDKDIDRWVRTFPSTTDSADVVKQKVALFNKMRKYVLEVNLKMIFGEMPLGQNKEVKDKINGFIGSLEQLTQKSESKTEASAEPNKRKSAAERLLDKMGAK